MFQSYYTLPPSHSIISNKYKICSQKSDPYHRNYFNGIKKNLEVIQKYYGPKWSMRLYYHMSNSSTHMKTLCNFACEHPELELCNVEFTPKFGK